MASCGYRFTFTDTINSDLVVEFSNDLVNWTAVSITNWLQVNPNDTLSVVLRGPSGWSLNGSVPLIIGRANTAISRQLYSPFTDGYVFYSIPSTNSSIDSNGQWTAQLGTVVNNPGRPNRNRFEITVAFNVTLPVSGNQYFSEDPEMDVIGN